MKIPSGASSNNVLNIDNVNPHLKAMEYACRGPLTIRAREIEKELANGEKKPFTEVIKAYSGDAQAMGQKPITFIRQVVAMVTYPPLLNSNEFPDDAKSRAQTILEANRGSMGCYSDPTGLELVRRHVAQFIERRDGFPSDPEDIILRAGASDGVRSMMKLISTTTDDPRIGVMVPVPQYPLFSACIVENNMVEVGYYLDEDKNWEVSVEELERSIEAARSQNCEVRAIVIINPGNPTGHVLSHSNIRDIVEFAYRQKLFILADEVYQENTYEIDNQFHSVKKIMKEMGAPYDQVELASFLSCSKGFVCECGVRGGYVEVVNLDVEVKNLFIKSVSPTLCPSVVGQAVLDCMVNPPQPGEPSYELFVKEKNAILKSLSDRALFVAKTFNTITGMKCTSIQGGMAAFPEITMPEKAIIEAESLGQAPDVFYAFQLLEQTGICVVPGSGFGQRPGSFHFRTIISPQPARLELMMDKFRTFHDTFTKKYQ